jgi:hypothetical protein
VKIYDAVLFWFGGVLSDTVADLTTGQLPSHADRHYTLKIRQVVRSLAEELALGSVSSKEYCQRTLAVYDSDLVASTLENGIIAGASLRPTVAELIASIPTTYDCWLVVDFPTDWWRKVSARCKINTLFPDDRIILIPEMRIGRIVPEIFHSLPLRAGRSVDACITIDACSARAVASTQHGLASIIYVYPERLKLELALQGIFPTETNIMHPTSSERVKIG